jgi:phage terminase small subunit
MSKAKHPYDTSRPECAAVKKALANNDMKAMKIALTVRQRAFSHEYVVDFKGKDACIRAGYSPKYADRQAYLNLHHQGIAAYIDHLTMSKAAKMTAITPDYIISRITAIINDGEAKDGDKLRGLEMLARHLGMFIDKTEITGKDGGAIEVEQRRVEEESQSFLHQLKQLKDRAESDKKTVEIV